MVTAPILSYPIDIDLPQKSLTPPENPKDPPEPIDLRIDGSGQVFWNNSPVPLSALRNMMEAEVQRDPSNQPTLQIDTSLDAEYGILAQVLAAARNSQMQKIGFVKK
jgi:biopolymer transport protein ExbD